MTGILGRSGVPAQSGGGLPELLVAIAAASLLLLAATHWLQTVARQSRQLTGSIEWLDTTTFALDVLERAVRTAGAYGLAGPRAPFDGAQPLGTPEPAGLVVGGRCAPSLALDLAHPVQWRLWSGGAWPPVCSASPDGRAVPGSAVLVVRRALTPLTRMDDGVLWVETSPLLGRLALASPDVLSALPGTAATETPLMAPARTRLEVEVYYVSRDSTGTRDQPSLRRKRLVGGTAGPRFEDEELAPGISRLEITPLLAAPDGSARLLELRVEWQALRGGSALRPVRRFVWIRNGAATPWA